MNGDVQSVINEKYTYKGVIEKIKEGTNWVFRERDSLCPRKKQKNRPLQASVL